MRGSIPSIVTDHNVDAIVQALDVMSSGTCLMLVCGGRKISHIQLNILLTSLGDCLGSEDNSGTRRIVCHCSKRYLCAQETRSLLAARQERHRT